LPPKLVIVIVNLHSASSGEAP